ncbi:MAG: hypothetical protein LBT20_07870 [Clostridiales bacterium]|jgi:hypothetical protein|nr:hypothetical protein [Clostridiales bacterium]
MQNAFLNAECFFKCRMQNAECRIADFKEVSAFSCRGDRLGRPYPKKSKRPFAGATASVARIRIKKVSVIPYKKSVCHSEQSEESKTISPNHTSFYPQFCILHSAFCILH